MRRALGLFLALAAVRARHESRQKLVKLNIVATDATGNPVTDLHPAEIHLREDGKAR